MTTNCIRRLDNYNFRGSDSSDFDNGNSSLLNNITKFINNAEKGKIKNRTVRYHWDYENSLLIKNDVKKSITRLDDIDNLEDDWNGFGAKSFSSTLINKCKTIVANLSVQPSIFPTGRNSIQFQYELEDRSYLEFEIFENRTICLLVPKRIYSNAKELEFNSNEEDRIKDIVDKFYGKNSTEKRIIIQGNQKI